MSERRVYFFGAGEADGSGDMKELLGGKGAGLAEMSRLGIPVPPGFTITTEMCTAYQQTRTISDELRADVERAVRRVEEIMGKTFGDPADPLLFSVRSGARVSMPGMMDTVLNLGLNDETVTGLAERTGQERFAYDSYRRLLHMYGDVVMGADDEKFIDALDELKSRRGIELDTELTTADLRELVDAYKRIIAESVGEPFPTDPREQLWGGVRAVFESWNVPRAREYRRIHHIPENWGTAVNVQVMVFGNLGEESATGVAFTRDPSTGERRFYGEFLVNAQGEDVVAGIRTPQQINEAGRRAMPEGHPAKTLPTLQEVMPEVYEQLETIRERLEAHYRNMQDIEFTIQDGKLWMLQTRSGKRTGTAAIRIAWEMHAEGLVSPDEALLLVEPGHLDQLLHNQIDPEAAVEVLGSGLPASPGAARGGIKFTAEDAVAAAATGERVLLVRRETSPEDIAGMNVAQGILTSRGGMTSHAAVVARGMGKPCVAGCGELFVDIAKRECRIGGRTLHDGDILTIDGSNGRVIEGAPELVPPQLDDPNLLRIMEWADEARRLKVRTNADTPHDAEQARAFGAEGIGLCRTEHMFFGEDRIMKMREMILAKDETTRRAALERIRPLQQEDFAGIFRAMAGLPVTVRLLDPPLHEFVPHEAKEQQALADDMGVDVAEVRRSVEQLHEANPMLGHRGCRLGLTYPEIYEVQVEAILRAAVDVRRAGITVLPEIMIPLTGTVREMAEMRALCLRTAERVLGKEESDVDFKIGTMIEVPRAALVADRIAAHADFFSFGTNDLTQMTFGYSRDDSGVFLPVYIANGILPTDPFQQLDVDGVGQLVAMACEKGRTANPELHLGICGEHGGDPSSIAFCHRVGLEYVSCSPFRVPIARLAAAHVAIRERQERGADG
jgi:pyruvate,orthophosphate dikinase